MGSIISAIHDDMEEYEDLCRKYKEVPQYKPDIRGINLLDCYGQHAQTRFKEATSRRMENSRRKLWKK